MVTTKKTSFPSLHSDQGHGLTKVWSKRNKSQNYKRKKEGLNASKSLGERRWEEGGLLEEGFNSQSVDISPKIIFTSKYVRFVINCCVFTHFLSSNPPECQDWGAGGGSSQSWQCQDFHGFYNIHPSLIRIHSDAHSLFFQSMLSFLNEPSIPNMSA